MISGVQDLSDVILYGSCARGDYHEDSDVDIVLLTKCDRIAVERYGKAAGTTCGSTERTEGEKEKCRMAGAYPYCQGESGAGL